MQANEKFHSFLSQILADSLVISFGSFIMAVIGFIVIIPSLWSCFIESTPWNCRYFKFPDLLITLLMMAIWITSFFVVFKIAWMFNIVKIMTPIDTQSEEKCKKDQ